MTTIIGLKTNNGKPAAILASDLTGTSSRWDEHGDIAIRKQSQGACQKLYVSNDGHFAYGISGLYDNLAIDFMQALVEGKIDFQKAVKKGGLEELAKMNISRGDGRMWATKDTNSLLAISLEIKEDSPGLFTCWPLGRIEPRIYTAIGSGSDYAIKFVEHEISAQTPIDLTQQNRVDVGRAIDLAIGGVNYAATDIYTGGLDLVVATQDGIKYHGKEMRKKLNSAEERIISSIKKEYQRVEFSDQ